jgi:Suppressor of fused protein (SUFU)
MSGTTPRENAHREALIAHLTGFLGDDHTLATGTGSDGIAVDLLVFAPSPEHPHPTLVTLGMSEHAMTLEGRDEQYRIELLLGLPTGWPGIDPPDQALLEDAAASWPLHLLRDTARIPSTDGSFLTWGHSVTNNGVPYDDSVPFTGALIGPPYGYPPQIMNATTPAGTVQFLAVLPATPEELALKASVPSGGDMVLDRLAQAGHTAVLDPQRVTVTDGPAPWRVHVLLTDRPEHLGDVLDGVLPNLAAGLGAQGIDEFVIPIGPEPLRWRVGGRSAPTALDEDLALAALPEEELASLRRAIAEHGRVLTLSPERPGDGATVAGAAAMVTMLVEAGRAAAVWLPHQHHVTLPARFVADIEGELPTVCRVHAEPLADGRRAVRTHGLRALGGTEILLADSDLSSRELTRLLERFVVGSVAEVATIPVAGQRADVDGAPFTLRESTHPDTGEEILEMVTADGTA